MFFTHFHILHAVNHKEQLFFTHFQSIRNLLLFKSFAEHALYILDFELFLGVNNGNRNAFFVGTTGTTAAATRMDFWATIQGNVAPTGTQTVARNMYSLGNGGSVSYCMANVANTGALASTFLAPSISLGNVTTTAGVNVASLIEDLKGALVLPPGGYLAWGFYNALAVAQVDGSLVWAEIPA